MNVSSQNFVVQAFLARLSCNWFLCLVPHLLEDNWTLLWFYLSGQRVLGQIISIDYSTFFSSWLGECTCYCVLRFTATEHVDRDWMITYHNIFISNRRSPQRSVLTLTLILLYSHSSAWVYFISHSVLRILRSWTIYSTTQFNRKVWTKSESYSLSEICKEVPGSLVSNQNVKCLISPTILQNWGRLTARQSRFPSFTPKP